MQIGHSIIGRFVIHWGPPPPSKILKRILFTFYRAGMHNLAFNKYCALPMAYGAGLARVQRRSWGMKKEEKLQ